MNRSILLSILSIFAVVGLVGGVTFAFFSDTETSSDNLFSSGTLNMQLSKDNSTFTEAVTGSVGGLALDPGESFTGGDLYLRNSGSTPADHVDLTFANLVVDAIGAPGSTTTPNFASVLEVTQLMSDHDGNGVADVNILPSVGTCDAASFNANGYCDLQDLAALSASGADITNLAFGGTQTDGHRLHMEGRLSSTAVNANQGDSNTLTLTVFMNQGTH